MLQVYCLVGVLNQHILKWIRNDDEADGETQEYNEGNKVGKASIVKIPSTSK